MPTHVTQHVAEEFADAVDEAGAWTSAGRGAAGRALTAAEGEEGGGGARVGGAGGVVVLGGLAVGGGARARMGA